MQHIKITRIRDVKMPARGTGESAGIDFFVPNDFTPAQINPGQSILIPSGIHVKLDKGYMMTAFNKSGVAVKLGLVVGAQVVDSDYQGEVHIHVINVTEGPVTIEPGMKLTQFVIVPISLPEIEEIDSLERLYTTQSERGSGGFGSTGDN